MTQAVAERMSQEPAKVEQHPATDTGSLLQIISRAASDKTVDIDKMERLMAMHERLVARDSEQAFNVSMKEAQSEMTRISADGNNPQTKSKYATYGKLDGVLRPIYTKHGFALSFDTGETVTDMVRVVAHVSHREGHTRTYHADMPADGKGAKGGDVMTKTHATGAAMTYGMRYLLKMIFNVAIGDNDRDGNATPSAFITETQAEDLKALIDKAVAAKPGTDYAGWMTSFLEFMDVAALNEIPAKDFGKAKGAIDNAIKAAGAKK